MILILTRHGETEENKLGIYQGHLPGKLTGLGLEQARKTALRLKETKIDYIYSSDLARASDTAKEIAKYHPDTPVVYTKELRETDVGSYQGKTEKERMNIKWDGESAESVFVRAVNFLHKTLENHLNDTVLVVGHSGINRRMEAAIMGKDSEYAKTLDAQHHTGISIFEIDENKNHKIKLLNCIKHLEDLEN